MPTNCGTFGKRDQGMLNNQRTRSSSSSPLETEANEAAIKEGESNE